MSDAKKIPMPLRDMIGYIRVQLKRGGYTHREGFATCPAELLLNAEAILDAAERADDNDRLCALVAQWIERQPSKLDVACSNPAECATNSAPGIGASHNSDERLPKGDQAATGAETSSVLAKDRP